MNQTTSILLYLAIILFTTLFTALSTNKRLSKEVRFICMVLAILVPSIFAGLRYNTGTDYQIHKNVFEELKEGLDVTKHTEIGYLLLNRIVLFLGGNYQILLFLISVITITCIYGTLVRYKEKISVPIGMLAFMLLYYQMSYNLIRQILAVSIMVYALKYLENRNILKYILSCIIASTIHSTALIFFILLPAYKYLTQDKYRKILFIIYICMTILVFTYPKILEPLLKNVKVSSQIQYYLNYLKAEYQPIGIGIFRYILLFIIPGLLIYRYKKEDKNFLLWYNTSIIGFILWLTSYVSERHLYRISYNFLMLIILLIGAFWKETENKRYKIIYRAAILVIVLFFWYYDYFYLGANATVPYIFCFGKR